MQMIGLGSHMKKYERKYENNEMNRKHNISFLFVSPSFITDSI